MQHFRIVLFFVLSLFYVNAQAQSTLSSPYSAYGAGIILPSSFTSAKGMGDISTAVSLPDQVNVANPASYANLTLTTLDMAIHTGFTNMKSDEGQARDFNYSFDYFVAGMPVGKNKGIAFGLLPVSSAGYNISQAGSFSDGYGNDVNYKNKSVGDGGYSRFFAGYGMNILPGLSVGVNTSYLFGSVDRDIRTEIEDPSAYNSSSNREINASGFMLDYGLQYAWRQKEDVFWTVGYSGVLSSKITTEETYTFQRYLYDADGAIVPVDTLINGEKTKGTASIPLVMNFGVSYHNINKLLIGLDFTYQNWDENNHFESMNGTYHDVYGIRAGFQYLPNMFTTGSYLSRIEYRGGFGYTRTNLYLNDHFIDERKFSLGVGLPLMTQFRGGALQSKTRLNLAIQTGVRGTMENDLVKERFTNLYLSLTFSDRWFIKRRFD